MSFDIIPILKQRNIDYKTIKDEVQTQCPVCGKEDHLYINSKKKLFICQKCKWEGSVVTYLIVGLGFTKREAVAILFGISEVSFDGLRTKIKQELSLVEEIGDLEDYSVFFKNPLPGGLSDVTLKKFPKALAERGISLKLVKELGIKYCNKTGKFAGRLIVPIRTIKNETFTAITALTKKNRRIIKEAYEKRGIKFRKSLFPFGSLMSEVLYLYDELKNRNDSLFITEGFWDASKVRKFGELSTCIFGNQISRRQAILFSKMKTPRLYLCLDGNVPEKALLKSIDLLKTVCFDKEIMICRLPYDKDPDDLSKYEFREIVLESEGLNCELGIKVKRLIDQERRF